MPTNPEVLDGYRGPRGEARADRLPGQGPLTIPAGKRRFSAIATAYRLQLTNPRPMALPDGRWLDPEKAKVKVFVDGVLDLDSEKDAEIIAMIEAHPYYGIDFHDVAPQLEAAEKARKDNAVKVILGLPAEDQKRVFEALKASAQADFDVKPKAATQTKEPEPVSP